jgi:methylated-DNA-protein-cysteine methyltransferase-like protein
MVKDSYRQIWQTVLLIPYGKVASYGQIADLAGLPGRARLVGKALGKASDELALPWHRVINGQGKISFAPASAQFQLQRRLLLEEGVLVSGGRVKLKRFQWQPDLTELLFKLSY